ncbi:hypothetical protein N431DRAFT_117528 [Stipitochalara longipes BDJ]|nr:hypothetical protein N431DRAFT_117528 [Stipitochalara longipes BDJ]
MHDSRTHAAMASRYQPARYLERQTFLSPPTPPPTPPSSKMSRPFPSITASKGEVRSYIRALLATYPPNQNRQSTSFDNSASPSQKPAGGLSTLPSFRSIRSLTMMTPVDVAICKIWFDGGYLRLLFHIGSLRRELRLLGFEDAVAEWLSREIGMRSRAPEMKGKGKYWERKMDRQREDEKVGCLRWFCMVC